MPHLPAYRLPTKALDSEIDAIRTLGAVFRMRERWGEDGWGIAADERTLATNLRWVFAGGDAEDTKGHLFRRTDVPSLRSD